MALDVKNNFLWYGTTNSTLNCLSMPDTSARREWGHVKSAFGVAEAKPSSLVTEDQVIRVKGSPKLVDKHVFNNKRFALTVNEKKLVQLWKLDDLEVVQTYRGADFNKVREQLSVHDMKHSPQSPLPQTWMSLDIGLGCLKLNMEENSWLKGVVNDKQSNLIERMSQGDATPGANIVEGAAAAQQQ